MAINEIVVTGRIFRRLIDKSAKLWQRISWWTKASDVEFDDGKTAEHKLGNINGITSSFQDNDTDVCASSFLTHRIKTDLNDGIINEHIQFVLDEDGNLGWKKDGADTVINFSSVTGICDKLKGFSRQSLPGSDCVYYLDGSCIPIVVWGGAHHENGVTYQDEWDIFKKTNSGGTRIMSVTPIASYTTKENSKHVTVVDKIIEASTGDTIIGWKIVGKSLDKGDTPGAGGFYCYYIDGQRNLKYDNLYKEKPFIEKDGSPYPLV